MSIKTKVIQSVQLNDIEPHPILKEWARARPQLDAINNFLDWCEGQGISLASWMGDELRQGAVLDGKIVTSREAIIAKYLGIDLLELERARQELLQEAQTPLYRRLVRNLNRLLGQPLTRETRTLAYANYECFFMEVANKHQLHRPVRIRFRVIDTCDYQETFPPPEALACPAPGTLVVLITKVSRELARAAELEGFKNFVADAEHIIVEEGDWRE
jgi:hypothetical protein